ncbi:hypothetical protein Tco_1217767 [Tanacetum coccineum]
MHYRQRIKFLRKTSFKGRHMILGRSSNGLQRQEMDECHKLLTNKVDLSNPEGHQILRNIYEPLPLGGPPGQLKAARYLDFGLEELVPSLWVESEREYDISAVYGITHWWFRRKEFYINKHSESSNREAVRSQMRILSVISVKRLFIVPKPRAVVYRDINMIKENEKAECAFTSFSDGTLTRVMEKLDQMVKTLFCTSTICAWRLGVGFEDDKREAKTSSLQSRKGLQTG